MNWTDCTCLARQQLADCEDLNIADRVYCQKIRSAAGWRSLFSSQDPFQGKFQTPPIVGPPCPYCSHKNPLKYGNGIGSLWERGPIIRGSLEKGGVFFLGIISFLFWELFFFPFAFAFAAFAFAFAFTFGAFTFGAFTFGAFAFGAFAFDAFAFAAFAFGAFAFGAFAFGAFAFAAAFAFVCCLCFCFCCFFFCLCLCFCCFWCCSGLSSCFYIYFLVASCEFVALSLLVLLRFV